MVHKPYNVIGFGGIDRPKHYKFIGFGGIDRPKPYNVIGFGGIDGLSCSFGDRRFGADSGPDPVGRMLSILMLVLRHLWPQTL